MVKILQEEQLSTGKLKGLVSWYGARHTQCIMLFLLFMLSHGTKVVLSVGIVAMTNPLNNSNKDIPTYSWNNKSVILSSFLWGYIITTLPAAKLSKIYGSKKLLVITTFTNSILCCLIPTMASFGSLGVIVCRVGQGLVQGFFFPLSHDLLGRWAPLEERSTFGAFVYTGGSLGMVVSLTATGWISGSSLGWPYAFYLYGALCLSWSIAYLAIGSNSPDEHTTIDPVERSYIKSSLRQVGDIERSPLIPWKKIFTSVHVWAIIVGHCGQSWGFWTLLTNIPTYMNGALHFNLQQNGLLSAGPYLVFWICGLIVSRIADTTIKSRKISVTVARKILNSIGSFVPAVTLIAIGIIGSVCNNVTEASLVLLFIAVGGISAGTSGYLVNHLDLSPVYAGTLMGISNAIATIFSIAGPLALQWIVTDETNKIQWATAFYITSGFYILSNTFFVIFASGEIQPWNLIEKQHQLIEVVHNS